MYDYMLYEMAKAVSEKCNARMDDAMNALIGYWSDKIAHVWQVTDMLEAARNAGKPMTRKDALELLKDIFDRHDSCQGITWVLLDRAIAGYHLDFASLSEGQYPDVHGVFMVWREHDPIAHQFGLFPHKTAGNLPVALEYAKKLAHEIPGMAVFLGCAPGLKVDSTPWLTLLQQEAELSITAKE
jgi:hypothetical protein